MSHKYSYVQLSVDMLQTVSLPFFHYNNYSNKSSLDSLSRAAELAVITGFSEASRRRKSLILGEERLNYIAPFSYLIYAYPWRGMSLLMKPFKSSGADLKLGEVTDLHDFCTRLKWASGNRRRYARFLVNNERLLETTHKSEIVDLGEFIPDCETASLIVAESRPAVGFPLGGMLPYPLNSEEAKRRAERFDEVWCSVRLDLTNLANTTSMLKQQLDLQHDSIKVEMSLIEEKAKREADKATPSIHRASKKLERKLGSETRLLERDYQKDLTTFSKTTRKLEIELKHRRHQETKFKLEKEKREKQGDKFGKDFWARELRACRRKIVMIEKRLGQDGEKANHLRSQLVTNLENLKASYAEKISFERQAVSRIEKQRDRNVDTLKGEMLQLEKYTTKIMDDASKLIDLKQQEMRRLGDFVVPWRIKEPVAISVPFYLARYSSRAETRYSIIPPVKVEIDSSRLNRAAFRLVGHEGRMTDILKPLDTTLSDMIVNDVSTNLTGDVLFALKADEQATQLNLLSSARFQQSIKKGLEEIVRMRLLSQGEASKIEEQKTHWQM